MKRSNKAFTLIEILVVVTIIVIGLAMAVPAISKFSAGQALENGGRVLQSAVNAARNAAITKSNHHYLVCFRDNGGVGKIQYGFAVYEKGKTDGDGFNKIKIMLPSTLSIETLDINKAGLVGVVAQKPSGSASYRAGCRLAVFDGMPDSTSGSFTTFFDNTKRDVVEPTGNKYTFLRFLSDGTASFFGCDAVGEGGEPIYRPDGAISLYNPDKIFDPADLPADAIEADFEIRQAGVDLKRCYVDIDANTGRARYRVVALQGYNSQGGSSQTN